MKKGTGQGGEVGEGVGCREARGRRSGAGVSPAQETFPFLNPWLVLQTSLVKVTWTARTPA